MLQGDCMESAELIRENPEICHCKHVTYNDVAKALDENEKFSNVEKSFEEVQEITGCSTGCGKCHDSIMHVISDMLSE